MNNWYFVHILKFVQKFGFFKDQNSQKCQIQKIDALKIQCQPITFNQFTELYELIKDKLLEKGYRNCSLLTNSENTMSYMPNILEIAEKSCCGQVRANGYFSICKFIFKSFELVYQELNSEVSDEKLKEEIDHLTKLSDCVLEFAKITTHLANETNLDSEEAKKRSNEELLNFYTEFHRDLEMFKQIKVKKRSNNSFCDRSYKDDNLINNNSINYNSINNNSFVDTSNQEFNSLPLFTPHPSTAFKCFDMAIHDTNLPHFHLIYGKHSLFWLDEKLRYLVNLYFAILPFLRVPLYRYFQVLFSSDYRTRITNEIRKYATINFPTMIIDFFDNKLLLHLYVDYATRNYDIKINELFVPIQNSIIINKSAYDRLTIRDPDEIRFEPKYRIRCKLMKPKNIEIKNCSKLMVYIHGGGFYSLACDSFEIYLKNWVDYNQIPILNVDYRLKEYFPVGLKDCFDVYLWLRMAPEEEIKSKLGFYPKQIVLAGDSSGANFAFGIVLVLNDLRNDYKNTFKKEIPMPNGLVCVYPPFLVNLNICPSRIFAILDPILTLAFMNIIIEGYTGFIPGLKPMTFLEGLKSFLFPSTDPLPWTKCDRNEFKRKINTFCKSIDSPYLSPLLYKNYDSLTDVPLYLLSGEFCPLLDDSITMAKIWKGPVEIDVLKNMGHAFLNLNTVDENSSNAMIYCAQKIKEIFEFKQSIKPDVHHHS